MTPDEVASALKRVAQAVAVQDRELRTVHQSHREFAPVWEVDRFHWPAVMDAWWSELEGMLRNTGIELLEAARAGMQVLGLSGLRSGTGCSTVAMCLARAAIQAGGRVALVDAAGGTHGLAEQMGVENPCGWNRAVRDELPLEEAATLSLEDNLTLFCWETPSDTAAEPESLTHARLAAVARGLARWFDLVIIDLPVWNESPAANGSGDLQLQRPQLAAMDALLLVTDARRETTAEVAAAARRLLELGIPAVGLAENFVAVRNPEAKVG